MLKHLSILTFSALLLAACGDSGGSTDRGVQTDGGAGSDSGAGADTGPVDSGTGGGTTCSTTFGLPDACGGAPEGTWNYSSACGTTEISDGIRGVCATVDIQAEELRNGTGTLVIQGGNFTTNLSGEVHMEMTVPASCAGLGCMLVSQALQAVAVGTTASCTQNGADCDCMLDAPWSQNSTGTIVTNGGEAVVTTTGGEERYYFCVEGNDMTFRQFTPSISPTFVVAK